ncbi:MAG: hypothetical protein KAJ66_04675 [Candidatus Omnitrophica bacterium]|nr:hypothetical protein [Candidatus Omnitrophota bacterium]
MKKKIIAIIVIVILIVIGGIIHLTLDMLPIDDSDLALVYESIPDEQNAFYYFEKASQAMYFPEDNKDRIGKILEEGIKDKDVEFVENILDKNKETFKYFEKGLNVDKLQIPEMTEGLDELIPYLFDWQQIALLNQLKSMYFCKIDKQDEAFEAALENVRFGYMINNSKGGLVHFMIGDVIRGIGSGDINQLVSKTKLSEHKAKEYISTLKRYEDARDGLIQTYLCEYNYLMLHGIDLMEKGIDKNLKGEIKKKIPLPGLEKQLDKMETTRFIQPLFIRYMFHPERTKSKMANHIRDIITGVSEKNYKDIDFTAIDKFMYDLERNADSSTCIRVIKRNVIGRILVDLLMPGITHVIGVEYKIEARIRLTEIQIALKAHKDNHGQLPNSLDELVPAYFDRVPTDPYDGQPIRYSKKDKIIYCVGENLEDDGVDESEENLLGIKF